MTKRIVAAALCICLALCTAVALAVSGTGGEGLITKSYVDGTYTQDVLAQADARIQEAQGALYQQALSGLEEKHSAYLAQAGLESGTGTYHPAFSDIRVKQGDQIRVSAGSGFLLLAGEASLSCQGKKALDLSNGWEKGTGALAQGRRYLVEEDTTATITVTSPTAVLSLEGWYALEPGDGVDYNALADALRQLGLFRGSDTGYGSGYDLEAAPTRIQALIMFLRILGEEQAALATTASCPFTDVPAWCQPYVAYAYAQGLTKGVDQTAMRFGTDETVTAAQFMTFILRALGYQDEGESPDFSWDTAIERAQELGVLTAGEARLLQTGPFLRAHVVYFCYFALDAQYKDGGGTLQDHLISSGALDAATVTAVRGDVQVERIS